MSTTIDNKVVEMSFNNKDFESNVSVSLDTISRLKTALKFDGATKGLETINSVSKKTNLSDLGESVDTVNVKFNALTTVATTALQNITTSAMAAGKKLVSAFTIDPIKSGLSEYETQINAIQTILANTESKGTTLTDVNNALDELNTYADKTIYNFTEMTRNIGTFTAAGVDLDTSVAAIKGIANLAAVSGSTSQQASVAMYQLSQALASGTVKLMDWNSVVNAGMGGQVFQDALKETARVHGIAIDEMIAEEGSFRETLSEGWLTASVLTETLSKFTGDLNEEQLKSIGYTDEQVQSILKMGQTANDAATKVKTFTQLIDTLKEAAGSGWTQSWELIIGDFEEARTLWTSVSDKISAVINDSSAARNAILQEWKDAGGRAALIESFSNVFSGLASVFKSIKNGFREIFPATTGSRLADITAKVRDLTRNFKMGIDTSKNLKNTFAGVFAVIDLIRMPLAALIRAIAQLTGVTLPPTIRTVLSFTGRLGELLVKLRDIVKESKFFDNVFTGLANGVKKASSGVKTLIEKIKNKFHPTGIETVNDSLDDTSEKAVTATKEVGTLKEAVSSKFSVIGSVILNTFSKIWSGLKVVGSYIWGWLKDVGAAFAEVFAPENFSFQKLITLITALTSGGLLLSISNLFNSASSAISKMKKSAKKFSEELIDIIKAVAKPFEEIGNHVTGILDAVRDSIKTWQTSLKADIIWKIAKALALIAGSIVALSLVDTDRLVAATGALSAMAAILGTLVTIFTKVASVSKSSMSFKLFNKDEGFFSFLKSGTGSAEKFSTLLLSIGGALLMMAGAVRVLANLGWDNMENGVAGLSALVIILSTVVSGYQKLAISAEAIKWTSLLKIIVMSINISVMIGTLATLFVRLSSLSWPEIARGMTALGSSMGAALVALWGLNKIISSNDIVGADIASIWGSIKKMLVIHTMLSILKKMSKILIQLASLSWSEVLRAIVSIGAIVGSVVAMSYIGPNAVTGVGSMTLFVAALTAMLTAFGALKQIPGVAWLVEEGGEFLESIGVAIGKFVGGILGGIVEGATSTLPAVGQSLTDFMNNASGFITQAKQMDASTFDSVKSLASAILLLTGSQLLNGITGWLTGGTVSLADFGNCIGELGDGIGTFAEKTKNVKSDKLTAACEGAKTLAEMMATLPKSGGLSGVFGSVDLANLPANIASLGEAINTFCTAFKEVTPDEVTQIAGAGKAIAEMMDALPKTGSIFECFTGKIDMSTFATQMGPFGEGIAAFAKATMGVNAEAVTSAGTAGKAIAELAASLPNSGGALGWLVGENDISLFDEETLGSFGRGIAAFAAATAGITGVNAEGLRTACDAAVSIAEMMDKLPNEGGLIDGYLGSNSIKNFDEDTMGSFGRGIAAFAAATVGINADAVEGGVRAMALVAQLADVMPSTGGVCGAIHDFFVGSSSESFITEFENLGKGVKKFAEATSGIDSRTAQAAGIVGDAIGALCAALPSGDGEISGGILGALQDAFTGAGSMEEFSSNLAALGTGMKEFGDATVGLNKSSMEGAVEIFGSIVSIGSDIEDIGGFLSLFTGDDSIQKFSKGLKPLGDGLKTFSTAVSGIDRKQASVDCALGAFATIVETSKNIENEGGFISLFTGDDSLKKFSEGLEPFAEGLSAFVSAVDGIESKQSSIDAGLGIFKTIVEISEGIENMGGFISVFVGNDDIGQLSTYFEPFGQGLCDFANALSSVKDIDTTEGKASKVTQMVVDCMKSLKEVDDINLEFADKIGDLGKGLYNYSSAISNITDSGTGKASAIEVSEGLASAFANLLPYDDIDLTFVGDLGSFGNEMYNFNQAITASEDTYTNKSRAEVISKGIATALSNIKGYDDISLSFTDKLGDFGTNLAAYNSALKDAENTDDTSTNSENIGAGLKAMLDNISSYFSVDIGTFADDMVTLVSSFKTYCSEMNKTDRPKLANAKSKLISVGIAEAAAEISPYATMDFTTLANGLTPFGQGLANFCNSVVGATGTTGSITASRNIGVAIAKAVTALEGKTVPDAAETSKYSSLGSALATYANSFKEVGEAQNIGGKAGSVATSIKTIADTLKDVKADNLTNITNSIDGLVDVTIKMAEVDSTSVYDFTDAVTDFADLFLNIGDTSLFGSRVAGVAAGMTAIVDACGAVTTKKLDTLVSDLTSLVTILGEIAGLDPSAFSSFKTSITDYLDVYEDLDVESISDKSAKIGESLKNLVDYFYSDNGTVDLGTLSSLIDNLSNLVDVMASGAAVDVDTFEKFRSAVSTFLYMFTDDDVTKAVSDNSATFADVIKKIADACTTGIDVDTFTIVVDKMQQLHDLAAGSTFGDVTGFSTFNTAINDFATTFTSVVTSENASGFKGRCESVAAGITSMVSKVNTVNYTTLNEVLLSLNDLITTCGTMTEVDTAKLTGFTEALKDVAENAITAFTKYFEDSKETCVQAVATLITSMITFLRQPASEGTPYLSFQSAGGYLAAGFANGIALNAYIAQHAAAQMAQKAADQAKATLDENSPSKVGAKIGAFFAVGFANGIKEYSDTAADMSEAMADDAKTGLSDAVSKIKDVIDGNVDPHPTIRPVLDLSEIQNGVGVLNNMLGSSNGTVSVVAKSMADTSSQQQEMFNNAVDALNRAAESIQSPNGTTMDDLYSLMQSYFPEFSKDIYLDGKAVSAGTYKYDTINMNAKTRLTNRLAGVR